MSATNGALNTALERLQRLEGYLADDPRNAKLRGDVFEAALRAGEWERAERHVREAEKLGVDPHAWSLRESELLLAQDRWDEARALLEKLRLTTQPPAGFLETVLHNLAYIDFRHGAYAECVNLLAPLAEEPQGGNGLPFVTQELWLRALHRLGEPERASRWAIAAEAAGRLDPRVAGVASLAALDAADLDAARRWSETALAHSAAASAPSMEALVTRSSLALAERNVPTARQLADAALQINPNDGRAWSARAFADLLAGDLATATEHFNRSVAAQPEHVGTWHGLGWTQILRRDLDGAQATFETALERDRNFAESHGGLAVVLAMKNRPEEAREAIERAKRLDKSNLSGRYAAAILDGEGRDAQALNALSRRLLAGRAAPLGGLIADWLPQQDTAANKENEKDNETP